MLQPFHPHPAPARLFERQELCFTLVHLRVSSRWGNEGARRVAMRDSNQPHTHLDGEPPFALVHDRMVVHGAPSAPRRGYALVLQPGHSLAYEFSALGGGDAVRTG